MAKLLPNVHAQSRPLGDRGMRIVMKPTGTARGKQLPAECQEFIQHDGNPGKSTSLMFVRLMAL